MDRATIILITLVSYKLILVGIGFWASQRTKDNDDFFLGGRGLGPIVASVSYAASSSSAWVLLGFSGMVYTVGVSAIWFVPGIVFGHYSSWKWIAPKLMELSQRKRYLTTTDLIAGETNGPIRSAIVILASIFIVVSFAFYVAAQFGASGSTFADSFGLSLENSVMLGALIILIYTLLGGFWAVSVTDTLQGLLMMVVSIVLPIAALIAVGGPAELFAGLQKVVTPKQLSLTGENAALVFIGYLVGVLWLAFGAYGQPQLLTRFMALKDEQALRQGRLIATIWFSLVFSAMFILGLCGHLLLTEVNNPEMAFFNLTNELMPAVIAGVVTAAVLSAIMSTADSQLLVAASAVSHDLGFEKRFGISPILVSRVVITLLCAVSVWITLQLPSDIFSRVIFAWSALGSAFGPIIIARAFDVPTKPIATLCAMVLGFGLTVYFNFFPQTPAAIFERFVPFMLALAIVLFVRDARLTQTQPAE